MNLKLIFGIILIGLLVITGCTSQESSEANNNNGNTDSNTETDTQSNKVSNECISDYSCGYLEVCCEGECVQPTCSYDMDCQSSEGNIAICENAGECNAKCKFTLLDEHTAQTDDADYISDDCIQIYAFNYDAAGNDNYDLNDEYVTFLNNCSYSIDMVGWTVKDESASHKYFIPSFTLQGGATFTLYTGTGANTASKFYWGKTYGAIWNNDGDTLYLRDDNGNLVLVYGYGS